MKTVGMLRVKNESRWIEQCISSILPLCETVHVMDDNSTDGTPFLCAGFPKVNVYDSPFAGVNESRDKQWLLERIAPSLTRGDWILHIDGDESLVNQDQELVRSLCTKQVCSWQFRFLYLWDAPDQVRVDRWYSTYTRPSLFSFQPEHRFRPSGNGGNFHCGSAPIELPTFACQARLLHYGYMERADRIRKYEYYNHLDPGNVREDFYKHMAIGDLFPADSRFLHAGPLALAPLNV